MNSCGAYSPRAAAGNRRKWVDWAYFLLPFPSLPVVRTTITCNKRKDATNFGHLSFSVFRSASPYKSIFIFFWLCLLLYFRRPALRSGRLVCGRQVLWVLSCLDCWHWPRRYWSWRWRCGVAVVLLSVLGAKIPKHWVALFFFFSKGGGDQERKMGILVFWGKVFYLWGDGGCRGVSEWGS
jgi:hypothetical protein